MDLPDLLTRLNHQSRQSFQDTQRIKSLGEYLADLVAEPRQFLRTSSMYLLDMIEHYGVSRRQTLAGELPHYQVFDRAPETDAFPVLGHQHAIAEMMGILRGFAAARRADKLVVLHGPNGSAKSSIVAALMRGLERYSHAPEGRLYRFQWVFPTHPEERSGVGFGGEAAGPGTDACGQETYAYLGPEAIAARLSCDLKDQPYLVLPRALRRELFSSLAEQASTPEVAQLLRSPQLLDADLCPRCKEVHESLLASYHGDLCKVLRHVQVERFFVSYRYRCGATVVEPQVQNVDGWSRQITMDQSIQNLPPPLQTLRLHEAGGDVIQANRGILEYSDLLKRPREAFKYLLVTSELGTLSLPDLTAYLDLVLFATVNELHLDEFKSLERNPDYVSFKARMEFVTIPYLLRVQDEAQIYHTQAESVLGSVHVAPHTIEMVALWAILTRLRCPEKDQYSEGVRPLIEKLTPLEKAWLYAGAPLPDRYTPEQARALRAQVGRMYEEFREGDNYEGRFGASPREIKTVLHEALLRTDHPCVNPLDVLAELRELCTRTSTHLFLRLQAEARGFRDPTALVGVVEEEYRRRIAQEVRAAMGLVPPDEYRRIFREYMEHARAFTTGQQVVNRVTGRSEPPDEKLMRTQEEIFAAKGPPQAFRRGLMAQVGAWSLEHPNEEIDYESLFPQLAQALREDVYRKKIATVRRIQQGILRHGHDDFDQLPTRDREQVEDTLRTLQEQHGYCEHCAREACSYLIRQELSQDR